MPFFTSNEGRPAQQAAAVQQLGGLKAKREIEAGSSQAGQQLQTGFQDAGQQLLPFQQVGQDALAQQNLLLDPQAQFDFLQSNPLFQASLDNLNQTTIGGAASIGRLTAGDTLEQVAGNTLLAAQPLLANQQQNIQSGLQFGAGIAGQQAGFDIGQGQGLANLSTGGSLNIADIMTQIANAQSSGIIGSANAEAAGDQANTQNILSLASLAFSDINLKEDIKEIGTMGEFKKYSWKWNKVAEIELGLTGTEEGVIAQEVELVKPELVVITDSGFKAVNYRGL